MLTLDINLENISKRFIKTKERLWTENIFKHLQKENIRVSGTSPVEQNLLMFNIVIDFVSPVL